MKKYTLVVHENPELSEGERSLLEDADVTARTNFEYTHVTRIMLDDYGEVFVVVDPDYENGPKVKVITQLNK